MEIYASGASFLVCLVGLLMFALSKQNPDVKRIGEIMFGVGLLVWLAQGVPLLLK